jgi:hypothetical protein
MRGIGSADEAFGGCSEGPVAHADTSNAAESADAAQIDLNTWILALKNGRVNTSLRGANVDRSLYSITGAVRHPA